MLEEPVAAAQARTDGDLRHVCRGSTSVSEHRHSRLLRAHCKRPCGRHAPDEFDKLTSLHGSAPRHFGQMVSNSRGREDFGGVFSDMSKARADALVVWPTPVFQFERRRLPDLAAGRRLPAVFPYRHYVDAGGLISYVSNLPDLNRRAAIYVGRILKGTKPSDLPVEQPTKFEPVINLKTAKALGIAIPASLLARADEVID